MCVLSTPLSPSCSSQGDDTLFGEQGDDDLHGGCGANTFDLPSSPNDQDVVFDCASEVDLFSFLIDMSPTTPPASSDPTPIASFSPSVPLSSACASPSYSIACTPTVLQGLEVASPPACSECCSL